MKRAFFFLLFVPLIFLFFSCNFSMQNGLAFNLRGTWETYDGDLATRHYGWGALEIGFSTVRVEGFHRRNPILSIFPPLDPPPSPPIPFEGFTRNLDMPAYSEYNMMILDDIGRIRQIQYFTSGGSWPTHLRLIFSSDVEVVLERRLD